MTTTRMSHLIRAPRSVVSGAPLDADAVGRWRVPEGMTALVR